MFAGTVALMKRLWAIAVGASIVAASLAAVPPSGAQSSVGWTGIIGGTGVLEYSAVQSVAVGDDGSVYVAGHFTESFSADTGITGFDVFVERKNAQGALLWRRTFGPVGPGLVIVDIDVDSAGNAWLMVNHAQIRVFAAPDGATPPGGPFPALDGDPSTVGATGWDDGYVVAEPASSRIRRFELDGTTTWTGPLDASLVTVEVLGLTSDRTAILTCSENAGATTISVDVLDAAGGVVLAAPLDATWRFVPGSGAVLPSALPFQDNVYFTQWSTADPSCEGAAPFSSQLTGWTVDTGSGVGLRWTDWESPQTYCLGAATVSLTKPDGPACVAPSTVETIDAVGPTAGGVFASRPDLSGYAGMAETAGGGGYLVDVTRPGPGFATAHRLDPRFVVADMDYGRGGELAVVGTVFPPATPGPGDPFNAQGFILYEPFADPVDPYDPPILPAPNPRGAHPFVDLPPGNLEVALAVHWAWLAYITNGIDATHFGAGRTATRAEAGVMLHRAAGSPLVATAHDFVDVVRDWQELAIRWLRATGITTGVDSTHFAPERPITRGEFAVMLWRMAGYPFGSPLHPFVDVVAPWQQEAIRWAKALGITTGIDATHFAPDRLITRQEMVVMLYRWLAAVV